MAKRKSFLSRLTPARIRSDAKTVAHIRLSGAIGMGVPVRQSLTMVGVNPLLEKAFSMRGIDAVAISINSPGGSPVQSTLIHDRIRQLAAKNEVEVITFCEDVPASGGYMLAISGDEIYAGQSSIIGSIGDVAAGFGAGGLKLFQAAFQELRLAAVVPIPYLHATQLVLDEVDQRRQALAGKMHDTSTG